MSPGALCEPDVAARNYVGTPALYRICERCEQRNTARRAGGEVTANARVRLSDEGVRSAEPRLWILTSSTMVQSILECMCLSRNFLE